VNHVLALILAATVQGATPGPPYYERPSDVATDVQLLQRQIASQHLDEKLWLERVALYTNLGELDSIAELIGQLTLTFPHQAVFREARMILESGRGHHALALELGNSILAEFPKSTTIRGNLARVHLANGELLDAINLMISAIETGPVRIQDWEFLLRALGRADHSAARTLERLQTKVDANPDLEGLKYLQVVLYTRFGQYGAARDVLVAHPELATHRELHRFVEDVNATLPLTSAAPTDSPTGKPQP
jgi:tetratricopeptide (TPR) repeat protein